MKKFLATLCVTVGVTTASAQQLAFPEAQGWGRFATGGRNGSVYHVTNLNDSGTGSLRDAVSQKNRIIVFDVAGVIQLKSRLVFSPNLYVAGQTAPGEGITVYGNGVSFSGASNIICRYMRFRMGVGGDSGKDCAGVANGTNMIFDHCSFAWGRDETFSINPDGKGDLGNITLQNCVVGQGLMSHSAGGLMQADHITLYGNFYCDNSTRNNKVKGRNQYANNIVYNWKDGAYIMGGDSEGQSYCNIQGNLFINGPEGGGNAFSGGNTNFHCYLADNLQDADRNGQLNAQQVTNFSGADVVATPYDYPTLDVISASSVIGNLNSVGASFPSRDYVDCYMVDEARSFGAAGAFISNEGSLPYGTPNTWTVWRGANATDTDGDGIPDEWEERIGSDPSKNDAMTKGTDGYAYIEKYLNLLPVEGRPLVHLRAPMLLTQTASTTTTMLLQWRDWTEGEEGFVVEAKTGDGSYEEVARAEVGATSARLTGLEPGTAYTLRMRAWATGADGDILYSDYSTEVTFKTRPVEAGIVDLDTYEPDAVWAVESGNWNAATAAWNTADSLYADGMKVLFETEGVNVSVTENVAPGCVVIRNDEAMTIAADNGVVTGATSVNKTGVGTLTFTGGYTYTGATVVHDGTFSFDILKNSGVASALGASEEFAQNWVFAGGAYEYTGASTTTNRSAKLLADGTFAVKSASTTVTMNGNIEGNNDFIIAGKGTVQPNTTKFFGYSGATVLAGGTLYLPSADITNGGIGSSSKLVFAGGTLRTKGETEGYENYTFPMEVRDGTVSQFSPNRNCYWKSTVTGGGTLQLNIPYVREYVQGNWDGFTGRLVANASSNGNLFLLNGKNIPNGVVELKNGARACGWDTNGNYTLGGLSGAAGTYLCGSSKKTDNFTCSWTIGTANTDETFRGIINNWSCSGSGHVGKVNITKAGTGVWRLTGANEYSGTTTVNAGTLVVNGAHSGMGLVTVNSDATLGGTGSLAGAVTVKAGGTVYAGDTLVVNRNTLTVKGKLTVQKNGIVCIPVSMADETTPKTNVLVLSGGASFINAILNLNIQNLGSALDLPEGTELKLFSPSGTVTGSFAEIQPAMPGVDKVWDTTDLLQKGILRVKADPALGIGTVVADSEATTTYDLSGRRVTDPQRKGVYIVNGKKIKR